MATNYSPPNPLDILISELNHYRLPIIIGIAGIVFIGASIILLTQRRSESEITFFQESDKSSSLSASMKIKADIEGAVEYPGVYEMTIGSRVEDLLIAAGGLSSSADRVWIAKSLNRALKISDGMKLYIPSKGESITNTTSVLGSADNVNLSAKININTATSGELDKLPGVGEVTATKIINGRPYQTIDELKSRKIVGNAVFEKIKDLVDIY